ncbi:MAG: hypothetical protein MRY59_04280 [Aquisalinus sp.]|nr:hypothetical protein [Aquisalinus sp.]
MLSPQQHITDTVNIHDMAEYSTFIVTGGSARNAKSRLVKDKQYIVGYDIECDIIVRDPNISDTAIELTPVSEHVIIECLIGTVEYNGKQYGKGEILFADYGSTFNLSGVPCVIENPLKDSTHKSDSSDFQRILDEHSKNRNSTTPQPMSSMPIRGALIALALALAIITIGIFQFSSYTRTTENSPITLQAAMQDSANTVQAGFLPQTAGINGAAAFNKISPEEQIIGDIEAILQHLDYAGQAEFTGSGQVRIRANISSMSELEKVERIIRQDLPDIVSISIESNSLASPRDGVADSKLREFSALVARISDSGLPYIVTTDGSWYFVGSVLPTGHELVDITGDIVKVRLNNQDSEVQF